MSSQNTAAEAWITRILPRKSGPPSLLGRRLVILILAANALLSLFATGVQLFASYERDRTQVYQTIKLVDNSFRSSFEDALWTYNDATVDALLDGVHNKREVSHLRLESDGGKTWERGEAQISDENTRTLVFFHRDIGGTKTAIGKLHISLTLDHIRARLWSHAWTLVLSNFAKTICAAMIMLFLLDQNLTRHLHKVAEHVSHSNWLEGGGKIALDRDHKHDNDELGQIVHAINRSQEKGRADFKALEQEVDRRRVVETLLRHRGVALKEANKEQAEFSYALSHDMKSPVNSMWMLLSELAETEGTQLSREGRDILDDAMRTNARMARLIDDVLEYAVTVKQDMIEAPVDLNAVAQAACDALETRIKDVDAQVTIGALPVVSGCGAQICLLLQNLIGNGIKFNRPGIRPEVHVSAHPVPGTDGFVLRVSDNGIGIEPAFLEKIFGLFQRLHTHQRFPGSGIGLAVSKRVASNHGATISVTSQPGGGSQFDVFFPKKVTSNG